MTPRTSLRAAARDIYGELAEGQAAQVTTPTPNPSPLRGGGEHAVLGDGEPTDLTARVRALYEGSAVPVREIARLAGVSERTIYKYVAKGGWTKRYRETPRGQAAAAANRGRRWQSETGVQPAKGAGGRFIRREEAGLPVATGLKATDPAGRAGAIAACRRADAWQREAAARAAAFADQDALIAALDHGTRMLADLKADRRRCGKGKAPAEMPIGAVAPVLRYIELVIERWQALAPTLVACGPAPDRTAT